MDAIERLLITNKSWAQEKLQEDQAFFDRLLSVQTPEFLWIGCSDSRVPANEITGTQPGEIFVHRNIANVIDSTDLNMLSVVEYAVEVLKVKYIIVCGHYGCGGVKAALTNKSFGLINKWLRNIKDVYRFHQEEFKTLKTEEEKSDRLVELNVMEGVLSLAKTTIIQKAWKTEQRPSIHGWVYSLENGLLKELSRMEPGHEIDEIYRYDFDL